MDKRTRSSDGCIILMAVLSRAPVDSISLTASGFSLCHMASTFPSNPPVFGGFLCSA
jgi:hypothetical protein